MSFSTIILTGVALLGANSDMNEASSLTFENDIVDAIAGDHLIVVLLFKVLES